MKFLLVIVLVVIGGYVVLHGSPAGRRALARMPKETASSVGVRKYRDASMDELQARLTVNEQIVAEITRFTESKPTVVADCGKMRVPVITPEVLRQKAELEADIQILRAEIASRKR